MAEPRSMFEKIWSRHVVVARDDGQTLLYIDRHMLHEGSIHAFGMLHKRGLDVRRPEHNFAVPDHYAATTGRGLSAIADPSRRRMVETLASNATAAQITLFGIDDDRHGIVHIIGPELGLSQPGLSTQSRNGEGEDAESPNQSTPDLNSAEFHSRLPSCLTDLHFCCALPCYARSASGKSTATAANAC